MVQAATNTERSRMVISQKLSKIDTWIFTITCSKNKVSQLNALYSHVAKFYCQVWNIHAVCTIYHYTPIYCLSDTYRVFIGVGAVRRTGELAIQKAVSAVACLCCDHGLF